VYASPRATFFSFFSDLESTFPRIPRIPGIPESGSRISGSVSRISGSVAVCQELSLGSQDLSLGSQDLSLGSQDLSLGSQDLWRYLRICGGMSGSVAVCPDLWLMSLSRTQILDLLGPTPTWYLLASISRRKLATHTLDASRHGCYVAFHIEI